MVNKVQLVFRKNNGDSFGTLGGLGYDSHLERRSRLIHRVVDPTVRHDNHLPHCCMRMHGRRASPEGPVERKV